MSQQVYRWKRFWCPRYPDSDRGQNPKPVSFEKIAHLPCLVLLGEAGTGKTTAIETTHQEVFEQTKNSKDVCLRLFRLGNYSSDTELCNAIFRHEAFKAWRQGTYKLHLFLDSLDEDLLSIKILARILKREIEELPCARLCLRITCRTAEWSSSLEEKLKEKWGKDKVGVYEIAPLGKADVIEAAQQNHIDSDAFFNEIVKKNAIPLASKPITLKLLLGLYRQQKQLPSSQVELYQQGCLQLCEEFNDDRRDAGFTGQLSPKKRMIVAGRIAAVMLFSNRSAVWKSPDYGQMPSSDIPLSDLYIDKEKADEQDFDVNEACIREVFAITGLFSASGSNHRIGFAHRTYAEFLASWYLKQHNLKLEQIKNLIIHPDNRVVPQLHETAAWLASMIPDVFQEIAKTDPDVLLRGDISTATDADKAVITKSLLKAYDQARLPYCYRLSEYQHLNHSGLEAQLQDYIANSTKHESSRLVAIDIARACSIKAIQPDLVNVTLDSSQPYWIRYNAAQTLVQIGDEEHKGKLKPLAITHHQEDPEDVLKGYALQAIFPHHMTVEELLNNITEPKSQCRGLVYSEFIAKSLAEVLPIEDIPRVLGWLGEDPALTYSLSYPFRELFDLVMSKAWQNCDRPDVLEAFAKVVIIRLNKGYILSDDEEIELYFNDFDGKCQKLIEKIVSLILISKSKCFVYAVRLKNIPWIIDHVISAKSEEAAHIWVKLLRLSYNHLGWQDTGHIDAILKACQHNSVIRAEFESDITPIELNSERAKQAKTDYLKCLKYWTLPEPKPRPDPPLQQRVLATLKTIEAGHPELWWGICCAMTLGPTSFKPNITEFPGWTEAEAGTRARIIKTAKDYLDAGDPKTLTWIRTNDFSQIPFAGYQALYLLSKQEPEFISTISLDTWKKWLPALLRSISLIHKSTESQDKFCQKIVRAAYQKASEEFLETLIVLMLQKNYRPRTYYTHNIYRLISDLLEQCLASSIFHKVQGKDLNAGILEILLTDLFEKEVDQAKSIAMSFLVTPVPEAGEARHKAIVAARMLASHSDNSSWSTLWSAIQQDDKFCREVLESIPFQQPLQGKIERQLKEDYVADFYILLSQQYPETEKPAAIKEISDRKNKKLAGITISVMEKSDSIKMWKQHLLKSLQERGTPEACDALRKIISKSSTEQKELLQPRLLEAEILARRQTWQPPKPEEVLRLILNSNLRLVQNGDQLLEVLIEALNRLQQELQGETPAARDLWDKVGDKSFKPVDENDFSDYVKRFLDRDLKSRGIIVNREVELRRNCGGNPGERTDIQVDAILKHPNSGTYDSVTVIIEVKGCWHGEVQTAMKTQLVERYLADNTCPYGLYLVGWFYCEQWDDEDSRKKKKQKTIEEAREQFDEQATDLSSSGTIVRSYVLNTALR